jgi:plastocyanin
MKNFLSIFLLLSAVMLAANSCATAPAANYNTPQPVSNTPVVTPPPAPVPVPAPKSTAVTVQVNIQNFSFNPAEETITVGSTVVWTNNDSAPHQIASNLFNSSALSQGGTFSYKFTVAGTYDYYCAIHPSMTGRIIVK